MLVKVTKEDIATGVKGRCNSCPVALAVSRTLDLEGIAVGPKTIYTWTHDWTVRAHPTPKEVHRFTKRFDRDAKVKPFEFELEAGEVVNGRTSW